MVLRKFIRMGKDWDSIGFWGLRGWGGWVMVRVSVLGGSRKVGVILGWGICL